MLKGIVVYVDLTCSLIHPVLSTKRTDETDEEFITRIAYSSFPSIDLLLIVDESLLPSDPLRLWRYNPSTQSIDVIVDVTVDWIGLGKAFSGVPCSIKDGLDKYYSRLHQAIRDKDEDYIQLIYLHMLNIPDNGIDQALVSKVVLKFGEYNLILPV